MNTYQYKTQFQMRTPMEISASFGNTTRMMFPLMWILFFTAIVPCIAVSQIDTSEQGMSGKFQKLMRNSETIVDAQVISKESRWDSVDGIKAIYTSIKFKVFQTIKGVVENNEFAFYQMGGMIGSSITDVSHSNTYSLNERAIYFFKNKNLNTYLQEEGRLRVRHGVMNLGSYTVDANEYIKIIKQSVTDTTAFLKYYHKWKLAEKTYKESNTRRLQENAKDTIEQKKQYMQKDSNTTSGGVK